MPGICAMGLGENEGVHLDVHGALLVYLLCCFGSKKLGIAWSSSAT
jgi:hypothetical protein